MSMDTLQNAELLKFTGLNQQKAKPRGRAYKPGESGNPRGRPKGAKDKRTAFRELLKPHAPALIERAVSLALEGDTTALKMCLDRLVSPLRPTSDAVNVALPKETGATTEGLRSAGSAILKATTTGKISTEDARALAGLLEGQRKLIELSEIVERIEKLETRL